MLFKVVFGSSIGAIKVLLIWLSGDAFTEESNEIPISNNKINLISNVLYLLFS
jgi:hypothetical protein